MIQEADIALVPLPQADGQTKNRPVLLLREMPPYGDMLVCGISTQLHQQVPGFDEVVTSQDDDFPASSLKRDSLIRLGFLGLLPKQGIFGKIGEISKTRHQRLLRTLADHLLAGRMRMP